MKKPYYHARKNIKKHTNYAQYHKATFCMKHYNTLKSQSDEMNYRNYIFYPNYCYNKYTLVNRRGYWDTPVSAFSFYYALYHTL